MYLYLKALHIIFVVTWFSALFYQVRLFIYIREAQDTHEPDKSIITAQLQIMSRRLLYGINLPSAVLTLIMGFWLMYVYVSSFSNIPNWLIIKLTFVFSLFAYYIKLHEIFLNQKNKIFNLSSNYLRVFNEVATVFLISIVFLVVVKDSISWLYAVISLFALVLSILIGIKWYKRVRL
jgi:putative membrane protein